MFLNALTGTFLEFWKFLGCAVEKAHGIIKKFIGVIYPSFLILCGEISPCSYKNEYNLSFQVWFQNRRTKWKRQRNALYEDENSDYSDSDTSEEEEKDDTSGVLTSENNVVRHVTHTSPSYWSSESLPDPDMMQLLASCVD